MPTFFSFQGPAFSASRISPGNIPAACSSASYLLGNGPPPFNSYSTLITGFLGAPTDPDDFAGPFGGAAAGGAAAAYGSFFSAGGFFFFPRRFGGSPNPPPPPPISNVMSSSDAAGGSVVAPTGVAASCIAEGFLVFFTLGGGGGGSYFLGRSYFGLFLTSPALSSTFDILLGFRSFSTALSGCSPNLALNMPKNESVASLTSGAESFVNFLNIGTN